MTAAAEELLEMDMVNIPPNQITPVNPALASRFPSLPFVGRVTEFRR